MNLVRSVLLAVSVIPLSPESWVELKYKNIASNQVSFVESSLKIQVNQSASPLIHQLKEPIKIEGFSFETGFQGVLNNIKPNEFPEDSYLRLGIVATGEKKLNWWQKKVAADWVLKLFSMAPQNVGLDKIYFYNVATSQTQLGQSRLHPKSDLMYEEIIAQRGPDQDVLEVNYELKKPLQIVALWLSSDGDDTKSQYVVGIKKITLKKSK